MDFILSSRLVNSELIAEEGELKMPAYPRSEIIKQDRVGVYHVTTRCVQQMFLLGEDYLTGRDFSYRKEWIITWLKSLADVFLIDVCAFSLLDNHVHLILRNRPDLLASLSDTEVAERLARLYSGDRRLIDLPTHSKQDVLDGFLYNDKLLARKKSDLADISVFMKVWEEAVSRRANQEMKKTGHFWQGRFSSQVLEDDAAMLACCAYVDLNPLRAGIVDLPEMSEFTSLRIRLPDTITNIGESYSSPISKTGMPSENWLAPIFSDEGTLAERSNFSLRMTTSEYFQVIDDYSRRSHRGKVSSIDNSVQSILERLGIRPTMWQSGITNFGRWFRRVVGSPDSIQEHNRLNNWKWSRGITASKRLFSSKSE